MTEAPMTTKELMAMPPFIHAALETEGRPMPLPFEARHNTGYRSPARALHMHCVRFLDDAAGQAFGMPEGAVRAIEQCGRGQFTAENAEGRGDGTLEAGPALEAIASI